MANGASAHLVQGSAHTQTNSLSLRAIVRHHKGCGDGGGGMHHILARNLGLAVQVDFEGTCL